jgi:hypothetical protein
VMEIRGTCGSDQEIYKQRTRVNKESDLAWVDLHERRACAGSAAQWLGCRCIELSASACTVLSRHGERLGDLNRLRRGHDRARRGIGAKE